MTRPVRLTDRMPQPSSFYAILAAWTDPGPVPAYHRQMQDELRDRWPALATALDAAARDATR